MKTQPIRVVTTKTDVPDDTVSREGFDLLDMGKEGLWLVDREHPGYARCVNKALKLAIDNANKKLVEKYSGLVKIVLPEEKPTPEEKK